eukprot:g47154.t1
MQRRLQSLWTPTIVLTMSLQKSKTPDMGNLKSKIVRASSQGALSLPGGSTENIPAYAAALERQRLTSVEFFTPSFDSNARKISLQGACFSLISTIVGGGVLSLPYAFSKAGLLNGIVFLLLVAAISDFSVYSLISCSRRGRNLGSYDDVIERSFGERAKIWTAFLLAVVLFLGCTAYLILIGDLITPLVEFFFGLKLNQTWRRLLMCCVTGVFLPFTFADSLHALRFISVFSRFLDPAAFAQYEGKLIGTHINLLPTSAHGLLSAAPLLIIAFLCHFNALPLHNELEKPDRARIKVMVHFVMFGCSAVYILVGAAGYLYARDLTAGNILNNFPSDDLIIVVGRSFLLFVCMCSMPLVILPCRNAVHSVLQYFLEPNRKHPSAAQQFAAASIQNTPADMRRLIPKERSKRNDNGSSTSYGSIPEQQKEQSPNTSQFPAPPTFKGISATGTGTGGAAGDDDDGDHSSDEDSNNDDQEDPLEASQSSLTIPQSPNVMRVYGSLSPLQARSPLVLHTIPDVDRQNMGLWETLGIVGCALSLALCVNSVATIWSILGSTASIVIAYILPAGCYLTIRRKKHGRQRMAVWFMLGFGVIALIVCTYQAIVDLFKK